MGFVADLQFGNKYEKIAIDLLEAGDVVVPPQNTKHSAWDFKHNGVAYEVKADRRACGTGNFAVEYECGGKPSGIETTQADVWIFFMVKETGFECYRIPIATLRSLCYSENRKNQTWGGRSKFYLLSVNTLQEYKWC